jgi:hypothetical protein
LREFGSGFIAAASTSAVALEKLFWLKSVMLIECSLNKCHKEREDESQLPYGGIIRVR